MFDIALCGPRPLMACGPAYDPDPIEEAAPATKRKPAKRKAKRKTVKSK